MNKIKASLFLLVTLIFVFFNGRLPKLILMVGDGTIQNTAMVYIRIFDILLMTLYIICSKVFFQINFGFKFSLKKCWLEYKLELFLSILVVGIYAGVNMFTSISLEKVFGTFPVSQIETAMLATLIAATIVGFQEEILSRVGITKALYFLFPNFKNPVLAIGIASSVIFGCIHLSNIFYGESITYTLFQVFYAVGTGFFFIMLYFSTKSIVLSIICHSLVDWSDFFFNMFGEPDIGAVAWVPIVLGIISFIAGMIIYKKMNTKEVQVV